MPYTTDHTVYLNELRDSGVTNMFGARPYLMAEFGIGKYEAGVILQAYIKGEKPNDD